MMQFHGYFRSSSAHRCRIAFNLKGVTPEVHFVHLRKDGGQQKTADYRRLNPHGLVPALEIDGAVLTQSLAIIEWLDETYPNPPLLPVDPISRAHVRAFALSIACDIHPLQNLRVLEYLRTEMGGDPGVVDGWCRKWVGDGLAACETVLASRPETTFAFGGEPTIADICLVPQVFSAQRFKVDLSEMPRVRAIFDRCMSVPAFQKAAPAAQPDAEQ